MGFEAIRRRAGGAVLALAMTLGFGSIARAQEWITPDACRMPADAPQAPLPADDLAAVVAETATIDNAHGRLWRVTGAGGQVSYLWGSLHSSDREITDLPPALLALIPKAAGLYLESDPVAQSRTELEERVLQAGVWLAPSAPPYAKTYLGADVGRWVAARVAAVTAAPEALTRLTDAGLATLLLADPCEDFAAGVLPAQDNYLYLLAYRAGVPVRGLEAWDAFLTEMSQPEARETARAIARIYGAYLNPQGFGPARAAGFRLYLQGRIGEMMVWNRHYLAGIFGPDQAAALQSAADAYLVTARNRAFVRALTKPLDTGGALIAVGAFHLPGSDGLIDLLRGAGYRVDRVVLSGEADQR